MTRRGARADPDWVPSMDNDDEEYGDEDEPRPKRLKPSSTSGSSGREPKEQPDCLPVESVSNSGLVKGGIQGIANPPLKIASFNIQVFGGRKMDRESVMAVIVKILQRYDLILILEIRDSSQTAFPELVQECNKTSPENPFAFVVSARLGRTSSKEQYGFMYRTKKLEVVSTYQFDDGVDDGTDMFQREPFAVRFYCPSTELEDFAIIATHTDPDEAAKEIGALHKVYESAKRHWNLEDIIIAGDFNADEGYVNREDWSKIVLRHDKRFHWLIKDSTDTTTGNTDRAYDRFVVAGAKLIKNVVPDRTNVFLFDKVYNLPYEQTRKVSDHYPIEMELCGKVNKDLQKQLSSWLSVTVDQKTPVEREHDIRKIYRASEGTESAHFTSRVHYEDFRMLEVIAKREDVDGVISALREFQAAFPNVLQDETVQMVEAYTEGSSLFSPPSSAKHPYIYGLDVDLDLEDTPAASGKVGQGRKGRGSIDVTIAVRLREPLTLRVTVSMKMSKS
ncbi:hypothetical protein EGW08_008473 [Elysia chlorotica]|uniref:Endonuclease/exonuclease/phosphatase domain-containing protein n=1 Tax=Elysia chlorotica TaxID=188477 RepID=A0A433TQD6_ELYCH|nr:hypothetical protein EGW08_008473 [Elysia chlorotica]